MNEDAAEPRRLALTALHNTCVLDTHRWVLDTYLRVLDTGTSVFLRRWGGGGAEGAGCWVMPAWSDGLRMSVEGIPVIRRRQIVRR